MKATIYLSLKVCKPITFVKLSGVYQKNGFGNISRVFVQRQI